MAIKTHKVTLSLDNPRVIQSGINVQSFDKQSIQISIELTKNDEVFQVPSDATIRVSLLKLARQEQKIIVDVPNNNRESIDWIVPDYLDGYQGTVQVGVYLVSGTENVDLGYFTILSNVSDIDKMADEFTDNVFQGWEQIEADLAEIRATIAQVNTLAIDFTDDVTSKYNAFDTNVTQAGQTIDEILALQPQFQSVLDETTGKDVISGPEIILARNGKSNLKTRLDEDHAQVTAQLAQKATYQTVFGMSNLSQEVKNAITGGSVAVVGKNAVSQANIVANAVTPTETDFIVKNILSDTLVDDNEIERGIYYEWNTGNKINRADYNSTGLIPCVPNETNTRTLSYGQVTFWDKDGDYVSGLNLETNKIVVPDDASIAYMRVANTAKATNFTVNRGEKLLPKDAYKEEYAFSLPLEIHRELTKVEAITSDLQDDLNRLNMQDSFALKKTMSYQDDYSYSEYRGEDTTFWTTHIHQNKFDGTVNYPKVRLTAEHIDDPNTQSVQQYVASNQRELVINAGIFNTNTKITDGYLIIDGEIVQDKLSTTHMYQHTLGVMQDGTLRSFEESVSPTELLAQGVQQAVVGFIPIIIDGEIPSDDFLKICPHSKIKNPRQVIGQYPNGDYIIFSCDGRKEGEAGMTLREAAEIMQKLGVSFAYNLDGGGSTQTYMGKKRINAPLENKRVPNVLVF